MTDFERRFIAARREVIRRDFSGLNDRQREAVFTTDGPLLLLAGAGSGKTTVLINRICNLIKYGRAYDSEELPEGAGEKELEVMEAYLRDPQASDAEEARRYAALDPVAPWRIIAITFTNKAANELKNRLETLIGPSALDVWASTFHSACCRMLRKDIDRLGFSKSFTIYDSADSERVMKDVLIELNVDDKVYPPKTVLGYISRAKDSLQSPEEFLTEYGFDVYKKKIGEAYARYQRKLTDSNALDFDDIICHTVRLLQAHADVREYYQNKFKYVLIDEYQDTNKLQYLLAALLSGKWRNICVVGDDDQSIYRFRGATIENILSFEKQYKDSGVIRLEQNYRSTQNILSAANSVISNNTERKGKELWTENNAGDKLCRYDSQDENDEAMFVAGRIFDAMAKGVSPSNFAVLYRMNAQSNALEYAFQRNGIPYRIFGGTRFFDRAEIKDMVAYLCVINNKSDDLRLKRIINKPTRGIGDKTVETAERLAAELGRPIYEVIAHAEQFPELSKSASKLLPFVQLIEYCSALLGKLPLDDFYDKLLEASGYMNMLKAKNDIENRTRAENVMELKSSIVSYIKGAEEPTLAGFLEEIALYTELEQYDADAQCAVMMTIHSAKGLEFPTVFLVGFEEGVFPGNRAMGEPAEMEEERRLCYVALTRAKEKLYLCRAKQRMLFGKTSANRASRFIEEIPQELVEVYGADLLKKRTDKPPAKQGTARSPQREKHTTAAPAASVSYAMGDMVEHRAFGKGMVISVQQMGGDAMLEIVFDNVGTKRLMSKSASQYMKKQ